MPDVLPIRRIEDSRLWVVPNVVSMAFDAARGRLLVANRREIRALDLDSGREVLRFASEGPPIADRMFHLRIPVRRAVALVDQELITWDTDTGRLSNRVNVAAGGTLDSISDDGRLAAISIPDLAPGSAPTYGFASRIVLVEVDTGATRHELPAVTTAMYRSTIVGNDGRVLVGDREGRLRDYDARGTLVREHDPLPPDPPQEAATGFGVPGATQMVNELTPLLGDDILIRAMSESVVRNRVTGARVWTMGSSLMESIVVSSDRKRIFRRSSSPQSVELIHDSATGAQEPLADYGVIEWNIVAEHDGVLATADFSGNIRIHRKGQLRSLATPLDRIPAQPESIAISRDGRTAVVGALDGSVRVLEEDRIRALPGHTGTGCATGFLEDGRLWTSSSDHHRVWSPAGKVVVEEAFLGSTYTNPQSTHDGRFLHGVRDSSVTVRSATTGRLLRDRVLGLTNLREGSALHDDGVTYFTVTEEGVGRWNLETGERTAEVLATNFDEQTYGSLIAAPHPSGKLVLLHGARLTYLWNLHRGGSLEIVPKIHRVTRARFHGGTLLLLGQHEDDPETAMADTRIHVIDLETLQRVDVLTGLSEPIRALHSSGAFVAAVAEDRTVCVWRHGAGG